MTNDILAAMKADDDEMLTKLNADWVRAGEGGETMTDATEARGRTCRHYSGQSYLFDRGNPCAACAKGHPVRTMVAKATGTEVRSLYKLPCVPGPEKAWDCPDYDPFTEAEMEARRAADEEAGRRAVILMTEAEKWRAKMVAAKQQTSQESCPVCGGDMTVSVSISLGYNNHLACRCSACGVWLRE